MRFGREWVKYFVLIFMLKILSNLLSDVTLQNTILQKFIQSINIPLHEPGLGSQFTKFACLFFLFSLIIMRKMSSNLTVPWINKFCSVLKSLNRMHFMPVFLFSAICQRTIWRIKQLLLN